MSTKYFTKLYGTVFAMNVSPECSGGEGRFATRHSIYIFLPASECIIFGNMFLTSSHGAPNTIWL